MIRTELIRPLLVLTLVGLAVPAWPCTVIDRPSVERLVGDAEVIAWVRAEGLSATPGGTGSLLTETTKKVSFSILEVLKGRLAASTIEFNGLLSDRDDRNERPVPYDFIRPGGRGGNCFALHYRIGAEYLLLLQRTPPDNELTPYWAALSPTNEQLIDRARDAWLVWVRRQLRGR